MTKPLDVDLMLAAYLDEGMTDLPDRAVESILGEVHRTRQWIVIGPWRTRPVSRATLAAAAVVAVVTAVALGGFLVVQRDQPAIGGPTPIPLPTATASATTDQEPARTWRPTGSMTQARSGHSATLLPDGTVLVAGGTADSLALATAELYDPRTGTWTATGSMLTPRCLQTATLLRDGTVLVVGGSGGMTGPGADIELASAEIYDPRTRSWSAAGSMAEARSGGAAALLPDGRVLVAGGWGSTAQFGPKLASAELYDPVTRTWTPTGRMRDARHGHRATVLHDGTVLVSGGYNDDRLSSAELYDPSTGSWIATGNLPEPFQGHIDALLPDGTVLIAGGDVPSGPGANGSPHAAMYDPVSRRWTAIAGMRTPRLGQAASPLADGRVLVMGGASGADPSSARSAGAELFDPVSRTWATVAGMTQARSGQTATLLPDGAVLVAGGSAAGARLASAELYER